MRIPAHSVCTAIRDDIVAGVHPRGSRLTEDVLARRYGVSRVPVREALRTLEAEGFVVTRRHAGACVAEPTEQEAADLLEMRLLLEPLGAARAAQRRTESHLKVLRGLVRLGRERAERGAGEELRALGAWFHETLVQASGSPALITALTRLRLKIAWIYQVAAPADPVASWAEHAAVVDAVRRGDSERARAIAALHVQRAVSRHRLREPGAPAGPDAGVRTARR
ncbi:MULTISPECIES: GntR family transcriptional regulator [Streptomyces]|uniref:GntR family transcriptional regulator n=1 Tax=Streptomyces thermoviolaceus subsp. thermoviolaceus TaxID=66860 RepID=A0ABX0YKT5_STRTL|nr:MULTISPECIES: GntR family transcriptional regulator [Streptomyces]MCM3263255.1 GntR family transcriptional regulator [Streptomyces thermoviolaceus]NJP13120.1 GntR family transcriptional regulator [Streptomyces thermoviolaceus subsp. thermoviolaceus]RSS03807.1 GntR family transcriptional regulator [Streptomyces sp. WAC00469]WTD47046.1 GntR family transcriptional regulator [Streptomyces thermoviolaceus]GGV78657.1 transcriptional regulator [Streptomyces thermoviolaceus subsp. apingens]